MKREIKLAAVLAVLGAAYIGAEWYKADREEKARRAYAAQQAAAEARRRAVVPDLVPAPAVAPDFALKLYRAVAAKDAGKNVFISPSGVRWALGMAYAGAASATRDEIAAVIGAAPQERNLRDEAARMAALMGADPKVKLRVANGLWLKKGFPFKENFIAALRQYFSAEVFVRDFVKADVKEANDWAARQTEGRIPAIIKEFGREERAMLVNALYFKGDWTSPFQERDTKDEDFTLANGKKEKRKLMHAGGRYAYYQGDGYQALRLPYGNGRLGMLVLLPSAELGLAALNARLTPDFWNALPSTMTVRLGNVALPRFKLEYSIGLAKILQALGMKSAFNAALADFSGMAEAPTPDDRLYITAVQQDTFVEVNEQGTEAAAVTRIGFARAACARKPEIPFEFRADRPFLYAITYEPTGEILFIGALN